MEENSMIDFTDGQNEYLTESFKNLNLSQQRIESKVFEDCEFSDCNFSETIFQKCEFTNCSFSRCDFSLAKPEFSQFRGVQFTECKMIGIDWARASWPKVAFFSPLKFIKCIINDSFFLELTLKEIVIQDCRAHDVDFRNGNFSGANFTNTDFRNSLFEKTNLTGTNFTGAINYSIDISLNTITKAKFSRQEAIRLLDSLGIELVD
jgi:fluoroquinolone resistance protein